MATDRKIIRGLGHSHVWGLARAARQEDHALQGYNIRFPIAGSRSTPGGLMFTNATGQSVVNPLIATQILPLQDDAAPIILSSLYGNGHFWIAASEDAEPFDIIHPECRERTPGERRVMPSRLMVEFFKRTNAELLGLFAWLKRIGYDQVLQISSPPPPPEPGSAVVGKIGLRGGVVAHPLLVLKVWYCERDALREICAEAGAIFVDAPSAALVSGGFTRPDLLMDGMHGTAEYGSLALAEIARTLELARA
jgi:hypothetical protein